MQDYQISCLDVGYYSEPAHNSSSQALLCGHCCCLVLLSILYSFFILFFVPFLLFLRSSCRYTVNLVVFFIDNKLPGKVLSREIPVSTLKTLSSSSSIKRKKLHVFLQNERNITIHIKTWELFHVSLTKGPPSLSFAQIVKNIQFFNAWGWSTYLWQKDSTFAPYFLCANGENWKERKWDRLGIFFCKVLWYILRFARGVLENFLLLNWMWFFVSCACNLQLHWFACATEMPERTSGTLLPLSVKEKDLKDEKPNKLLSGNPGDINADWVHACIYTFFFFKINYYPLLLIYNFLDYFCSFFSDKGHKWMESMEKRGTLRILMLQLM